jgi:casein kinase II subunit alpha
VRVASRPFKPPEILSGSKLYDYSFDMWSVGALFAGLMFRTPFMFPAKDNLDTLVKIVKMLGARKYFDYLERNGLTVDESIRTRTFG